ncbi:hypothetical protein J4E91_010489 [Alternaria rosae]|nr:hypothetical protein J4E91_010489 [Alternaria rosae]
MAHPTRDCVAQKATEPLFFEDNERYAVFEDIKLKGHLYVYKDGVSGDTTMGRFNQIRWRFPSYKRKPQPDQAIMESGFDSEYEQRLLVEYKDLIALDIHMWVGMVAWFDGMPFGVAGESGALVQVHAMGVSVKGPLGLHIGSPHASRTSRFLCIDAYFLQAHSLGLRLEFAFRENEGLEDDMC